MYKITSTCLIHRDDTQSRKFSSAQCSLTSTETIRTVRDAEPRTATSTFIQLPSSEIVQRCFTSTDTTENLRTIRTIRDGEPRTATSTFTQLLSSAINLCSLLIFIFRSHSTQECPSMDWDDEQGDLFYSAGRHGKCTSQNKVGRGFWKMKMNVPTGSKVEQGKNSFHLAKHAWLYSRPTCP